MTVSPSTNMSVVVTVTRCCKDQASLLLEDVSAGKPRHSAASVVLGVESVTSCTNLAHVSTVGADNINQAGCAQCGSFNVAEPTP